MKIAIEGCAHGELNKIYECLQHIELRESIKIDLLICCGDFQSVRDRIDMNSMAVPDKYMQMKDFWEYYTGKRVAPVLTIFIGGNHEASSYLWELPYGGWVAENIYYMGYSGVVSFAGIRIGGMSGIFKKRDYYKDHFEIPPFNNDTKRSFYHVRRRDVEKMKLLKKNPPNIVLSHDWPANIYNHGDKEQLMRFKPFLREDIESNTLGNEGAEEVLNHVQPPYWFSGHMHAKFAAIVEHPNGFRTKFLALDKCLPKRKFLQILDMGEAKDEGALKYDLYWLGILKTTNGLTRFMELSEEYTPSKDILNDIQKLCCHNFDVLPFAKSINGQNSQTKEFCERFGLTNPCITQTWKSIKQTSKCDDIISDDCTEQTDACGAIPSPQMYLPKCSISNSTPKPKMVLPKPGTGDTTIKSNKSFMSNSRDDDEFGDLTNPSSFDVDGSSSSSSNSSGSSSSSNNSEEDSSDDDNITIKTKIREPPSFIETPISAKTPTSKCAPAAYPPASTPLKYEEDGNKMGKKELLFTETQSTGPVADVTSESSLVTNKTEVSKVTCPNVSDTSDIGSDVSLKEGSETSQGEREMTQTPIKKFKLVRRNQSIYTPTKEEE